VSLLSTRGRLSPLASSLVQGKEGARKWREKEKKKFRSGEASDLRFLPATVVRDHRLAVAVLPQRSVLRPRLHTDPAQVHLFFLLHLLLLGHLSKLDLRSRKSEVNGGCLVVMDGRVAVNTQLRLLVWRCGLCPSVALFRPSSLAFCREASTLAPLQLATPLFFLPNAPLALVSSLSPVLSQAASMKRRLVPKNQKRKRKTHAIVRGSARSSAGAAVRDGKRGGRMAARRAAACTRGRARSKPAGSGEGRPGRFTFYRAVAVNSHQFRRTSIWMDREDEKE